jgi:uracil-DNA glycosylase
VATERAESAFKRPPHGYLMEWATQGVLLLNSTLTVRGGTPNSHQHCGSQIFTNAVIQTISARLSGVVFLL